MNGNPLASPTRPVDIAQIGRAALRVRWADGHASEFPLPLLRRNCRCAACKGHEPAPASASPFRVLGPEPSAAPAALEQVGNYGLGVHWADGHYSIYAFDALRHDCPCPECTRGAGAVAGAAAGGAAAASAAIVPLVLAAGKGERLGGNKALLDVGGTPALRRVLRLAAGAGLGPAVVVLGHEAARVRAMIDAMAQEFATAGGFAVRCALNADPDRGQTNSVQCGLAALPADAAAALVWPVDHPLVTSDDLLALAAAAAAHPEAAVIRPTHGGRSGHPVLLRRALFPAVLALPPSAPLRDLLRGELARTVFVERPTDHVLRDLDTPADLAAARPLMTPERPA